MAFWEGVVAGFGIAIPVGAIAILIIDTGLNNGFWAGFSAGAGAATVDTLYAAVAVMAGVAVLSYLAPISTLLRVASAFVLIGLGLYGLLKIRREREKKGSNSTSGESRTYLSIYARFFGITLLNPLTIAYFGALILGRSLSTYWTSIEQLAFIIGAGLASLSWQTFLAATGTTARYFFSEKAQNYVSVAGNIIVIALGVRIFVQL